MTRAVARSGATAIVTDKPDDLKGAEMDPKLTRAARQEELDEFRSRRVYDVVPPDMG